MLKRLESKGLVSRRRQATDERRVLVDLTPKGFRFGSGQSKCWGVLPLPNVPLEELFDLKDRLRHFVNSAAKDARTPLITLPARAV